MDLELSVQDFAKNDTGILPVTPSKLYTRTPYTRGRGRAGQGWQLPGNGRKRESCGTFKKTDGCLRWLAHEDHKVKIRVVHYHCNSLACPICAGNAMSRGADRITHRVVEWWKIHPRWAGHHIKPIHVAVSVSPEDAIRLQSNYRRMRDIATEKAEKSGFIGGAMIYHPFRHKDYGNETLELNDMEDVDLTKGWYYSPHFHLIGFGWIEHEYQDQGWIVKNIGVRGESPKDHRIFELARYQLSHCGVNSKHHTITWIGQLSARKYKAPPMPCADFKVCEECGSFFMPVTCEYKYETDVEGIHSEDPAGWRYVSTYSTHGSMDHGELNSIYEDLRGRIT